MFCGGGAAAQMLFTNSKTIKTYKERIAVVDIHIVFRKSTRERHFFRLRIKECLCMYAKPVERTHLWWDERVYKTTLY